MNQGLQQIGQQERQQTSQQTFARRADAVTSHDAASQARRFVNGHCRTIMSALGVMRTGTAKEIAAHTDLDSVQVSRRLPELERHKFVRVVYVNGELAKKEGCRVWSLCNG